MTYTEMKEWYKNNEELCLRLGQYHLDWLNEQAEKLEKIEKEIQRFDDENITVSQAFNTIGCIVSLDPQKSSVDWGKIKEIANNEIYSDIPHLAQAILEIKSDIDDIKHDIKMM